MKTLRQHISQVKDFHSMNEYIQEKLVHQQVDEKLIVCHQQVDEKLIVNKDYGYVVHHRPNEWYDIKNIIIKKCADEEFQKTRHLDMSDVDVSNLNDMSYIFNSDEYTWTKTDNDIKCGVLLKNMKSVDISGWDTSNVKTFLGMFRGCEKLEKIIGIEDIDVSAAHIISHMFYECKSLKKLDLRKWKINNVTILSNIFSRCANLEEILGLENWQFSTTGKISLDGIFNACYGLEKIDISNWNVENVHNTDNMFRRCYELKSVGDLSKWNPEHLNSMEKMFYLCLKLRNIGDIENWPINSKKTDITQAFEKCDKSIIPSWYKEII